MDQLVVGQPYDDRLTNPDGSAVRRSSISRRRPPKPSISATYDSLHQKIQPMVAGLCPRFRSGLRGIRESRNNRRPRDWRLRCGSPDRTRPRVADRRRPGASRQSKQFFAARDDESQPPQRAVRLSPVGPVHGRGRSDAASSLWPPNGDSISPMRIARPRLWSFLPMAYGWRKCRSPTCNRTTRWIRRS